MNKTLKHAGSSLQALPRARAFPSHTLAPTPCRVHEAMAKPLGSLDGINEMGVSFKLRQRLESVSTKIIHSSRTTTLMTTLVLLLAIFSGFLSSILVVATRPTSVNGQHSLTDSSGHVVSTSQSEASVDLLQELPTLGANFDYTRIRSVRLPMLGGAIRGHLVTSYMWYNNTDLDLVLTDDKTLHIVDGAAWLTPTCVADAHSSA